MIEKVDVSFVGLGNLGDGSGLLNPYLTYRFSESAEVFVSGYFFFGSETSEFGLPNWSPEITVGGKWAVF